MKYTSILLLFIFAPTLHAVVDWAAIEKEAASAKWDPQQQEKRSGQYALVARAFKRMLDDQKFRTELKTVINKYIKASFETLNNAQQRRAEKLLALIDFSINKQITGDESKKAKQIDLLAQIEFDTFVRALEKIMDERDFTRFVRFFTKSALDTISPFTPRPIFTPTAS